MPSPHDLGLPYLDSRVRIDLIPLRHNLLSLGFRRFSIQPLPLEPLSP